MALFAVQANPYTDRTALTEEYNGKYGNFKTGDVVQVKEWQGKWVINYILIVANNPSIRFINVHLYKLGRNGQPNKYNSTTRIENLMPLDAKQPDTDKDGLTAKEYAEQIFQSGHTSGCAAGYAVHDYTMTTRQSLVKVVGITKTGRVRVQQLRVLSGISAKTETIMVDGKPQTRASQEISIIDWSKLRCEGYGEAETYTPRLHDGVWKFWRGVECIKRAGMELEWLLD